MYCINTENFQSFALVKQLIKIKSPIPKIDTHELYKAINLKSLNKRRNYSKSQLEKLINFFDLFNQKDKKLIKEIIEIRLNNEFDSDIYYSSVFANIIHYKKHLKEYISEIPKRKGEISFKEMFGGQKDDKNHRLNNFVNLAYFVNLDLNVPEIQSLSNGVDYYEWLLNLKSFDYSKFKPYWVLEYLTQNYIKKFREIKEVKMSLEKYLIKKKSKGVTDAYLQIYGETIDLK
ncbi:MAG: hypothetical protein R3B93_15925 [Bacteroidia bacterium]